MTSPSADPSTAPSADPSTDRNPIGTHVLVGKGLVAGALADAERLGCETLQVFVGNPRGWALTPGKPAEDEAFRVAAHERGIRTFIHSPYLVNLGSPTAKTYENSVAVVAHNLRRAAEIGAEGVVHLPTHLAEQWPQGTLVRIEPEDADRLLVSRSAEAVTGAVDGEAPTA